MALLIFSLIQRDKTHPPPRTHYGRRPGCSHISRLCPLAIRTAFRDTPHPLHPLPPTHTPTPQPVPTTFRTYISFRCRRSWPESGLSGLGVGRGLLAFISPLGSHICCVRDMNTVHRQKCKRPCDFPTVREMPVQARRDTIPHPSDRRKFTRLTAFCWRGCGEGRPQTKLEKQKGPAPTQGDGQSCEMQLPFPTATCSKESASDTHRGAHRAVGLLATL